MSISATGNICRFYIAAWLGHAKDRDESWFLIPIYGLFCIFLKSFVSPMKIDEGRWQSEAFKKYMKGLFNTSRSPNYQCILLKGEGDNQRPLFASKNS